MKPITGIIIALVLLTLGLMCGCGHQPMGTCTPVAIFGQVECYVVTNIYFPGSINIEAATQAMGLKNPGGQGQAVPDLGIGNGSTAYIFGPTIWGYQGYKAPVNENTVTPAGQ